jgi:hypothetical protein
VPPRELHELTLDQIVEHLDYLEQVKGGDDGGEAATSARAAG